MESGKLSYRLAPVYVAISLALVVPYAQADCASLNDISNNRANCDFTTTTSQLNFNLPDRQSNNITKINLASDLDPAYSIERHIISDDLQSYSSYISQNNLAMTGSKPAFNDDRLNFVVQNSTASSNSNLLVINGQVNNTNNAVANPIINLVADKVVIRTSGNETKGVHYIDNRVSDRKIDKNNLHSQTAVAGLPLVSKVMASDIADNRQDTVNSIVVTNVSGSLNNHTDSAIANKIPINSQSAQAIKTAKENVGMVTIYSSGKFGNSLALPSLVYANIEAPIGIDSPAITDISTDIYARLATNENITIQDTATIIGEYSTAGQSTYISKLTISNATQYQENTSVDTALGNAILINKSTGIKTLQTDQAKNDGIIAMQNLNYITTHNNKLSAIKLFDRLTKLEQPSAIQVGYQIKDSIVSGLAKSSTYPDGMINIRADQNTIGKTVQLNGNYVINSTVPYIDESASSDGSKMTGNITIYDANSTKVFVNNTTIYFQGDKAVSAINVVDVTKNSANTRTLDLSHIVGYKLLNKTQGAGSNISLVGFTNPSPSMDKTSKKPKQGA